VHELLDQYPGEAIRLLLLSAHYRQPLDFTHEGCSRPRRRSTAGTACLRGKDAATKAVPQSVEDALSDDLNTPLAISAIHQLDDPAQLRAGAQRARPAAAGRRGVVPLDAGGSSGPTDAEIEAAIAARQAARKAKDFKESDRIRERRQGQGVSSSTGRRARPGERLSGPWKPIGSTVSPELAQFLRSSRTDGPRISTYCVPLGQWLPRRCSTLDAARGCSRRPWRSRRTCVADVDPAAAMLDIAAKRSGRRTCAVDTGRCPDGPAGSALRSRGA
jgi:hypothetical protein